MLRPDLLQSSVYDCYEELKDYEEGVDLEIIEKNLSDLEG